MLYTFSYFTECVLNRNENEHHVSPNLPKGQNTATPVGQISANSVNY